MLAVGCVWLVYAASAHKREQDMVPGADGSGWDTERKQPFKVTPDPCPLLGA